MGMGNLIILHGRVMTQLGAALTFLMAACGGDPDRRVMAEVDTVGGVVVVRNGAEGLWRRSEEWRVVEEFRVGNVQGNPDEELATSRNNSVTLGPNGQIFVLDRSLDRIVVFSGGGEFVRSFGRSGEGPGEFRSPMALAWDGTDRLWVADGLNGRYHVFDSTGSFQKSVPRPVRAVMRIQLVFRAPSYDRVRSRFNSSSITTYRDCDGVLPPTARSGQRRPVAFAWSRLLRAVTRSG